MHYIIGTRFNVIQQRAVPGKPVVVQRRDRTLPTGVSYQLIHIQKKEEGMEYQFLGSDGKKYPVIFPSCRDADLFIAKHLNQVLPNYNQPVEQEES